MYLYDPKTREFSEKLYQDPNYDVGGFTGTCRNASGSAGVDYDTRELLYVTYEAQEPVNVYFDEEIAQIYNGLEAVFPNEWVRPVTRDKDRNKMVIRVSSPSNPGDYYFYNRPYHFLQDQYLAENTSLALAHLCLALKLFLAAGLDLRIFILASPYLIIFSLPPLQALTTNFLPPCTCRLGVLHFILDLSIAIV